jgi:hypothetical protein
MTERQNLQNFKIECLSNDKYLNATIRIWIEKIENPTVNDIITDKTYNFQGKYYIFFVEYQDENGLILKNESDRINNAFYGLCKKVENENIKMIIKGCSLGYYMIPRLHNSIKTIKLTLGERVDSQAEVVCIFDPEEDVNKIVTIDKIIKYYNEWLETIKGLPY